MRESGLYTEKALEEERKKALLELSSKYERWAEHIRSVSRSESWEEDEEYQKSLIDLKRFNDLYGDTRFVPVELGEAQGVKQGEAVEFHSLERILDDNDIPITARRRF